MENVFMHLARNRATKISLLALINVLGVAILTTKIVVCVNDHANSAVSTRNVLGNVVNIVCLAQSLAHGHASISDPAKCHAEPRAIDFLAIATSEDSEDQISR